MDTQMTSNIIIRQAIDDDMKKIYRFRYDVFSKELEQYMKNQQGEHIDQMDPYSLFVIAEKNCELVGLMAVTPVGSTKFSIEKYFSRDQLPFDLNDGAVEMRQLAIAREYRKSGLAYMLFLGGMSIALDMKARKIVGLGHDWVTDFYISIGAKKTGIQTKAGKVNYDLLYGDIKYGITGKLVPVTGKLVSIFKEVSDANNIDWRMKIPLASLYETVL